MSGEQRQHYGNWLRERRQNRGLDLTQISQVLKIDEPYLQALEAGNIAVLPEPYIRAFLKTYATFLGLDPEEAARRFESFLEQQRDLMEDVWTAVREKEQRRGGGRGERPAPGSKPTVTVPTAGPSPTVPERPAEISRRGGMMAAAVVLLVFAAVVWAAIRFTASPTPEIQVTGPAAAPAESTAAAETPSGGSGGDPGPGAVVPPAAEPVTVPQREVPRLQTAARTVLEAEALEDTWMLAIADGDTIVSRVVTLGRTIRIPFTDTLHVRLGKTDGMVLRLAGRELTDLGPPGMVLTRLVLTPEGVVERRVTFPPDQPPPGAVTDRTR